MPPRKKYRVTLRPRLQDKFPEDVAREIQEGVQDYADALRTNPDTSDNLWFGVNSPGSLGDHLDVHLSFDTYEAVHKRGHEVTVDVWVYILKESPRGREFTTNTREGGTPFTANVEVILNGMERQMVAQEAKHATEK